MWFLKGECRNVRSKIISTRLTESKMQKFHNDGLFSESLPLMDELRHQGKLCDVTLKVKDQSFSAHRIILSGAIPYFCAMFTSNMAESRMEEITMQEIEPCALESLINYAYTATVQIDKENAHSLLVDASFLQLDKVRDACADFLTSHLDAHNVLCLRQWGESLGCNILVQAADEYINRHFSEITKSQEFFLLTSDQLIEIIQRDGLSVQEERIFEACMRWVKYNREERSEQFPAVFSRVRLPLLTPQFLVDHVCNEELVETSLECKKLVDEVMEYHFLPERRQQLQRSFRTQPRCAYEQIFILAVEGMWATVGIFDPLTGTWKEGPSIQVRTSGYIKGVAVGAKVYLFGDDVLIYDFKGKVWSRACSIPLPRSCPAIAAMNEDIYLCGGSQYQYQWLTNFVNCFCTKTGVLRTVAAMRQGRTSATAISLDKFVYVLGGESENSILNSVERYDPTRVIWENVKSMLTKRKYLETATLNGKLYACGGFDGKSWLKTVEVYHPYTNKWYSVAPMNCRRQGFGLVSHANKLWAIGGFDGGELTSVEVYNPETNKWTFRASKNVPKECKASGVLPA